MNKKTLLWGIAGFAIAGALILAYTAYVALNNVPDFSVMRSQVTLSIRDVDGNRTTRQVGPSTPDWVSYDAISPNLIYAVVSQEDTSFFFHKGVDYHEIGQAIKEDLKKQKFARGASTITQQVIKNVFLDSRKTIIRKLVEFFWAKEIEKKLSKKEILAFYLNMAEFGPGIYGIGEAARYYFGSSPGSLSAREGAFIAMMLPSPRKYHDKYFVTKDLSGWPTKRINRTLRVMYRMKFIEESTYMAASTTSLFGEATLEEEEVVLDAKATPAKDTEKNTTILEVPPEVTKVEPLTNPSTDTQESDSSLPQENSANKTEESEISTTQDTEGSNPMTDTQ